MKIWKKEVLLFLASADKRLPVQSVLVQIVNKSKYKVVLIFEFELSFSLSILGVLNLYSLIHPLANFKSKIYPPNFVFLFSLLHMPIVICKSVNFLLTKLIPRSSNLPPVENP